MTRLPAPVETIEVPKHFAVSQLGERQRCFAKSASGSQVCAGKWAPLPSGPWAAKGTLAHRVFETFIRSAPVADPGSVFVEEVERLRTELENDPARAHFAALPEVFGRAEWSSFRAWVLGRCVDAARGLQPRPAASRGTSAAGPSLTGVEVWLSSDVLRLRGRADRIRRIAPDVYEIRDYKTGTVVDDDDEVSADTVLQLRAYGLMLAETEPSAEIVLVVDVGREYAISFDPAAQERARGEIGAMAAKFPAAGRQAINSVAVPGGDCLGCRMRHVCRAYLAKAPEWWARYPEGFDRIPNDTWGEITSVATGPLGSNIVLTDAAGRRVHVEGLARRHGLEAAAVGDQLWAFELEASGTSRDFKGRRYHPRVFHELPRDRRERRAWAAQAFSGSEQTEHDAATDCIEPPG